MWRGWERFFALAKGPPCTLLEHVLWWKKNQFKSLLTESGGGGGGIIQTNFEIFSEHLLKYQLVSNSVGPPRSASNEWNYYRCKNWLGGKRSGVRILFCFIVLVLCLTRTASSWNCFSFIIVESNLDLVWFALNWNWTKDHSGTLVFHELD